MHPAISIIMSVYNEPIDWISQAIDSILCQTFSDFEFIIVSDNPSGIEQNNLLKKYAQKDKRIKLIYNEVNKGLAYSLNKAIDEANGEFIARMDADDISHPNRFRIQYDFLKHHSEISVCGTWAKRFGNMPFYSYKSYKAPVTAEQVIICSLFASPMVHPSVMGRSHVFKEYQYNSQLLKAQDYDLWRRLLMNGCMICNLPKYLLKYRITAKSKQSKVLSFQKEVATSVRSSLLLKLLPDISEEELFIHGLICENKPISNMASVEQWLLKMKRMLVKKYPLESSYINKILNDIWFRINIYNNLSFKKYYKSELYFQITIVNALRFLKVLFFNRFK